MNLGMMFGFIDIYSISRSSCDLLDMIAIRTFNHALRKPDFFQTPVVLGLLLAADMEDNLRRA